MPSKTLSTWKLTAMIRSLGCGRWLLPALHGPLCLRTLPTECQWNLLQFVGICSGLVMFCKAPDPCIYWCITPKHLDHCLWIVDGCTDNCISADFMMLMKRQWEKLCAGGDHLRVPATKRPRGVFATPREVRLGNIYKIFATNIHWY